MQNMRHQKNGLMADILNPRLDHGLGSVNVAHAAITCLCGATFDGFGDRGAANKFKAHMESFGLPCDFQEVIPAAIARPEPSILRRITTEEELDALPVGSVVLSEEVMHHEGGWPLSYQRWQDGDWHRGARSGSTHPDNFLPVTVLHTPTRPKPSGNSSANGSTTERQAMTNQVIPAEAVEAAAKAMLAAGNHVGGWDALPVFMQDNYLRDARAALEAAAPYIAGAWHDAVSEAYVEGALSLEQASAMWNKNPYRRDDAR